MKSARLTLSGDRKKTSRHNLESLKSNMQASKYVLDVGPIRQSKPGGRAEEASHKLFEVASNLSS